MELDLCKYIKYLILSLISKFENNSLTIESFKKILCFIISFIKCDNSFLEIIDTSITSNNCIFLLISILLFIISSTINVSCSILFFIFKKSSYLLITNLDNKIIFFST